MVVNKNSNQSQVLKTCCLGLYNERRSTEEVQRNKTFSLPAKHKNT